MKPRLRADVFFAASLVCILAFYPPLTARGGLVRIGCAGGSVKQTERLGTRSVESGATCARVTRVPCPGVDTWTDSLTKVQLRVSNKDLQ